MLADTGTTVNIIDETGPVKLKERLSIEVIPVLCLVTPSKTKQITKKFSGRFEGIRKIKDLQLQIHVDYSTVPVAQPHRRIPFHMRKKVEAD